MQKSEKAGLDGFLIKPVNASVLFDAIMQAFGEEIPETSRLAKYHKKEDTLQEIRGARILLVEDNEINQQVAQEILEGAGLARLMGNKRLYRKLLLDFGSQYTGVTGDIRQAIDKRDFQQAHSLVHNLQGLAGNLAATDLQAAALEIEKLVKANPAASSTNEQLTQKFTALENAVNQALEAVQALEPVAEDPSPPTSAESLKAVAPGLIKDMAGRVRDAIEMGDVTQVSAIAEELKSQSEDLAPTCDQLMRLADDFDLDGILEFVNELDG